MDEYHELEPATPPITALPETGPALKLSDNSLLKLLFPATPPTNSLPEIEPML
jgi:hypothetical protein